MFPAADSLRAAWLTGRRAGLQRSLLRIRRYLRLRLVDPYLAEHLYPAPAGVGAHALGTDQHPRQ